MVEGVTKTFDSAIKDFLVEANAYKEDLEGMLDKLQNSSTLADDYVERVATLEEAIELVEQAIDAVEALPG